MALGDISKSQIKNLRKTSCEFISTNFLEDLTKKFAEWKVIYTAGKSHTGAATDAAGTRTATWKNRNGYTGDKTETEAGKKR